MKADVSLTSSPKTGVSCGKQGCVVFYKGEHCMFCKPANEILKEALAQFGLSEQSVFEIDIGEDESVAREAGIVGIPTIKICNEVIMGLPDEGSIRDAIVSAVMRDCFCE
ncbi:MAG: thioredoxin domain-containing protein [Candidatus Thorarchaeota archaeon]